MTASGVRVERVDPGGDVARLLLDRYYGDLDGRFPGGFEVARTVAAPAAELVAPHGAFLAVFVGGDPVGCGAVRRLDEATAEGKRMWIDPAARGRGLGRRLLGELEAAAARELGCRAVRLDTSAHLVEAIQLYGSAGYREIASYNDNPYAAHWMEKALTVPSACVGLDRRRSGRDPP